MSKHLGLTARELSARAQAAGVSVNFYKNLTPTQKMFLASKAGSRYRKARTTTGTGTSQEGNLLPDTLDIPGGGGDGALSFASTEAGERLSADLRFQLTGQRQILDRAVKRQSEEFDTALFVRQAAQSRELEAQALRQERAKLAVSMIGKDVGRFILFALTSGKGQGGGS